MHSVNSKLASAVSAERPEVVPPPAPNAGRRRWSGLGSRLFAAALFVPSFLVITWRGEFYFVLLVNMIAFAGQREFQRLVQAKGIRAHGGPLWLASLALPWLVYLHDGAYASIGLVLLLLAILSLELFRRSGQALVEIAVSALGILYVCWLLSYLVFLRELPTVVSQPYGDGFKYVTLVFLLTWMSDTGAYVVGSLIGRHKLAPRISPAKSIEGAAGGALFAIGAGMGAAATFMGHDVTLLWGALLGALASVFGLLGDLVESLLKRDAQLKDASSAIPGHGGVLDRFDSVLFAAPLLYYVLRYFVL